MTASVPRADAPIESDGLMAGTPLTLRGLRPGLWVLFAYLFVALTAVDEEWPAIGRFQPTLVLASLLLLFCAGEIMAMGLTRSERSLLRTPPAIWWAAYFLGTLLSTVWAYDVSLAAEAEREIAIALVGFPAMVLLIRTRREFVLVVLVICLSEGFYLARSFQEFLNGRIHSGSDMARMVGAGKSAADPNSFAATIVFSLPFIVWLGNVSSSRLLRLAAVAYGMVGAFSVVMTRSRAGFLMLGLVGLWTLWVVPSKWLRIGAAVAFVLFGLFVASRLTDEEIARYESLLSPHTYQREKSTQGRIEGVRVGIEIFTQRPLLGIGPGNWSDYRVGRIDGKRLMPHNLAGQVIAEFGLVGTVCFFGFLIASFVFAFRERRRLRAHMPADPWALRVHGFLGAMVFVLALLLISGIASHNLAREAWALAPGLMVAAVRCGKDPAGD